MPKSKVKPLPKSQRIPRVSKRGIVDEGRPEVHIDENLLKSLCQIQCTYDEMATILGIDKATLSRRFATSIKRWSDGGRSSLRRAQFRNAITKNSATMQIWLGKQYLGQVDKAEVSGPAGGPIEHKIYDDPIAAAKAYQQLMAGK